MGIFSRINYYNNKIFRSTITISFLLTLIAGLLFFVSVISNQTFAQNTLTIKEILEQSFGKENGGLENQTRDKGETGFTMEDLNPEEDLAKEFANETSTKGLSKGAINALKAYREQSPEYKAKQALTYKYNELQEKFYLECIVNKESGEFKNTINCMNWSHDNAQIQLGLK
jgi:hypothetical protein